MVTAWQSFALQDSTPQGAMDWRGEAARMRPCRIQELTK
jgi:hypothetical protein